MTGTALQASTWTPGHLEHVTGPEAVHCCRAQLTDMPSPQRRRQQQQCPLARQNRRTLCHHTERFGETLRRHTASRDDGYATGQSGRPTKQAQVARMHLCDTASSTCSGGEGAAPCGILWHSMEMSRFCSPPFSGLCDRPWAGSSPRSEPDWPASSATSFCYREPHARPGRSDHGAQCP